MPEPMTSEGLVNIMIMAMNRGIAPPSMNGLRLPIFVLVLSERYPMMGS